MKGQILLASFGTTRLDAMERAGLSNVRIASVEAGPDLEDAIRALWEEKGGSAVRGLGEYPQFRRIYREKLLRML